MHPCGRAATFLLYDLMFLPAGVATRRGTSRATLGSTRLEATTEQQEGHALLGDQEANANTIDNSKTDSSKGQDSSDTPKAAASATVELGDGSSGAGGEEEEVGPAPSVAAVTQEVDAAAGLGQTAEEAEVMAELLAQQPGGQEGEGDEAAPDTMVSNAVLACSFACGMCVHAPPYTGTYCTSRLVLF